MVYLPSLFHGPLMPSQKALEVPLLYQWKLLFYIHAGSWVISILQAIGLPIPTILPVGWWAWLATIAIAVQWLRVWPWTCAMFPPQYQSTHIAINGRFDAMTDMTTTTGKTWFTIKDPKLAAQYNDRKIPLFDFIEGYRLGKIDLLQDLQVALRHHEEWAVPVLTAEYAWFLVSVYIPDVFIHSRGQDKTEVTEHYNTGNDFFGWYLGHRMVYTCGYFINGEETLEEAQDNKMAIVAQKIQLEENQTLLDLGCGWGTWALYAAKKWGVKASGLSISSEQIKFAQDRQAKNKIENVEWLCRDYRDMPRTPRFDRITCFEMAEHVGIKRFPEFLRLVWDALNDNGIFYLQIAGLRECWQHEDVIWGLFMDKYIFRGADASLPLNWVTSQLERCGFEVHSSETIGVHYATTINKWYENWQKNKSKVTTQYDENYFRTWDVFLGWSSIIPEAGRSTCYQLVCHKNLDNYNRRKFWGEGPKVYNVDNIAAKRFEDLK